VQAGHSRAVAEPSNSRPRDLWRMPGPPKSLLVGALRGVMTDEIVHRPKRRFTMPFDPLGARRASARVGQVLATIGDSRLGEMWSWEGATQVGREFEGPWSRPSARFVLRWCELNL